MFKKKKKSDSSVTELQLSLEGKKEKEQEFLQITTYPKKRLRKIASYLFYIVVILIPIFIASSRQASAPLNQTNVSAFVSKYVQNYFYYDTLPSGESSNEEAQTKLAQMQITDFSLPVFDDVIIKSSVQAYNIRITEMTRSMNEIQVYVTVDVSLSNESNEKLNERFHMKIVILETEAQKYLVIKQPAFIDNSIDLIASSEEKEVYLDQYKADIPNNVEPLNDSEIKQSKDLLALFFELYGVDDVKVSTMVTGSIPKLPSGITYNPDSLIITSTEFIEEEHFKLTITVQAISINLSTTQTMIVEIKNNKIQSIEMKGV